MDTQKPLSLAGLSAGDMVAVPGGIQIEEDHMRNVFSRNTAMQSKWSPRSGASLEQRLWLDEVEDVLALHLLCARVCFARTGSVLDWRRVGML